MAIKRIILYAIKYFPSTRLRVFVMRNLLGYTIGKNVSIGKSIINCKKVTIGDNVVVANRNVFACNELNIGDNTAIHSANIFMGMSNFFIGENSRIINNHHFDLWNSIKIGNNTWIAGKGSQFWTHGSIHTKLGNKDLSIVIGDHVYVGSSCCFAPGVKISPINLIGLGSVVSGVFPQSKTIIAGNPAVVIKQDLDWRINW